MIKTKPEYILLYLIGFFLLIFGNRQFWQKIQEEEKTKIKQKKIAEQAEIEFKKPFEVQELTYDSIHKKWENNHINFQRVVVPLNFNARTTASRTTKTETNDDENASDSL